MKRPALTEREKQVLDLIRASIAQRGIAPTYDEMAAAMGLRRPPDGIVASLEAKRYLLRSHGRRGITLLNDPKDEAIRYAVRALRQVSVPGALVASALRRLEEVVTAE